jgi:hypothetical protein
MGVNDPKGGEERSLMAEARRVARKTLMYGKNWRANGGATVCVTMSDAVSKWERETGKKWDEVFGRGKA